MSSDKILLPDFLIADLYKDCLVDAGTVGMEININRATATATTKDETSNKEKIKYLGKNGKNIIVVISEPATDFLAEEELALLTGILKACQFSLSDIAIINIASTAATYANIKDELNALHFLFFGTKPTEIKMPFTIPAFQIQNYDGCTILASPSLTELNAQTQDGKMLKTKLWLSLRQIFDI